MRRSNRTPPLPSLALSKDQPSNGFVFFKCNKAVVAEEDVVVMVCILIPREGLLQFHAAAGGGGTIFVLFFCCSNLSLSLLPRVNQPNHEWGFSWCHNLPHPKKVSRMITFCQSEKEPCKLMILLPHIKGDHCLFLSTTLLSGTLLPFAFCLTVFLLWLNTLFQTLQLAIVILGIAQISLSMQHQITCCIA